MITNNSYSILKEHGWSEDGIESILRQSDNVFEAERWIMIECQEGDLIILYPVAKDNRYPYKLWRIIDKYIRDNDRVAIPITFNIENQRSILKATEARDGVIVRLDNMNDLLLFSKDTKCHQ